MIPFRCSLLGTQEAIRLGLVGVAIGTISTATRQISISRITLDTIAELTLRHPEPRESMVAPGRISCWVCRIDLTYRGSPRLWGIGGCDALAPDRIPCVIGTGG